MRQRRGSALIMILAMVGILSMLIGTIAQMSTVNLRSTAHNARSEQAQYASLSGVQAALSVLSNDPGHTEQLTGSLPTLGECRYVVDFVNNYDGSLGDPHVTSDGATVPKGMVFLRVQGWDRDLAAPLGSALAYRLSVTATAAAFGNNQVSIADSKVSTWDKSNTTRPSEFDPLNNPLTASKTTTVKAMSMKMSFSKSSMKMSSTGTSGLSMSGLSMMQTTSVNSSSLTGGSSSQPSAMAAALGTNATDPAAISVTGSSSVTGNLLYGPGTSLANMSAFPNTGGQVQVSPVQFDLPAPAAPYSDSQAIQDIVVAPGDSLTLGPGAFRTVDVQPGATLTLTGGDYYFKDLAQFTQANLVIDNTGGPVKIYVGAQFSADASSINQAGLPSDLQIYSTAPASLNLTGGSLAAAAISGKDFDLKVDQSSVFGALMADTVSLSNSSKLYYDQRLEATPLEGKGDWTQKSFSLNGSQY